MFYEHFYLSNKTTKVTAVSQILNSVDGTKFYKDTGQAYVKSGNKLEKTISIFYEDDDFVDAFYERGDNVASATKLSTARRINGEIFDGTSDITVPVNVTTRTASGNSTNYLTFVNSVSGGNLELYESSLLRFDSLNSKLYIDHNLAISSVNTLSSTSSYQLFNNGLCIQWATVDHSSGENVAVDFNFPLAFDKCFSVVANANGEYLNTVSVSEFDDTTYTLYKTYSSRTISANIIAIGYIS